MCCRAGGGKGKSLLDKLQGYDYDPSAQPDEEYPDDSVSQIADDDHLRVREGGPKSKSYVQLWRLQTLDYVGLQQTAACSPG